MDEIQLRMKVTDVARMADAIDRDINGGYSGTDEPGLISTLAWLRYRLARAAAAPASTPAA
jgi:hypothetical protein